MQVHMVMRNETSVLLSQIIVLVEVSYPQGQSTKKKFVTQSFTFHLVNKKL